MAADPYAIIMAGGKGERFWPLSTARRPKQVLSLFGGRTLLAMAVERLDGLIPPERVIVITSAELAAVTREALPMLPAENVIGEPIGRDTAAACALGLAVIKARDPDTAFCVLTADQIIGDLPIFRNTLRQGLARASRDDVLVTIGLEPSFPSTGFGYIDAAEDIGTDAGITFRRVRAFVEKPDRDRAEAYVASGHYYWNGGMFIWSVASFERALASFQPALHAMVDQLLPTIGTPGFDAALADAYAAIGRISIDYAVMEKATNIIVARGVFTWDDVGAWPALANHFTPDADGNVVIGNCEARDASGNIVVSETRLTALLGVQDLVIVHADGATLVCSRERAQDVKQLLAQVASKPQYKDLT